VAVVHTGWNGHRSSSHRVVCTAVDHDTKRISGRTRLVDRHNLGQQLHVVTLDRRGHSKWIKWMRLNHHLVGLGRDW
jgi:endonuclease III